jgi:hypothetical protein
MTEYLTEKAFYDRLSSQIADQEGITLSLLFGKPCLKSGRKAFAAFYQGDMVFKIGREEIAMLREKYIGSQQWDPSGKGRAMKDWLQVPFDYREDWAALAEQALTFTAALS